MFSDLKKNEILKVDTILRDQIMLPGDSIIYEIDKNLKKKKKYEIRASRPRDFPVKMMLALPPKNDKNEPWDWFEERMTISTNKLIDKVHIYAHVNCVPANDDLLKEPVLFNIRFSELYYGIPPTYVQLFPFFLILPFFVIFLSKVLIKIIDFGLKKQEK
eukprot:GHVL01028687.1.p1 GENE.GHVL01028687.1~~GHVL01028687.1.p1  ORF type:complete len:160 (+),score=39.29 GHVL01028687.1:54-533(+)